MAVQATPTAQETGELGSRDDHAVELTGTVASYRGVPAEHAIEIGDPAGGPAAAAAAAEELAAEHDAAGWVARVASMNQRLQQPLTPRGPEPPTIFRVPRIIRDVRPDTYEPKFISFGPYHRGRERLQPMEEQKWRYLRHFLSRKNGSRTLEDYMRKMKDLEFRARSCYADAIEMDSNEFAEMMTLDGCFLAEFMLRIKNRILPQAAGGDDDDDDDIVFDSTWAYPLVVNDMLLLENQLPFFVLLEIWSLLLGPGLPDRPSTNKLVWYFLFLFSDQSPTNSTYPDPKSPRTLSLLHHHHHHLLHLFHSYVLPMGSQLQDGTGEPAPDDATGQRQHLPRGCTSKLASLFLCRLFRDQPPTESADRGENSRGDFIPSATGLTEAGVKFRMKDSTVLEATFSSSSGVMRSGVIWISPLRLFDHTDACVRNLIAFEQCFPRAGNGVSNYFVLVDCLVNTPADVALLQGSGVLINGLSSDEKAARVINDLCTDAAYNYNTGKLYDDVNRYRRTKWRRWRAELAHTYFSNPWTVISVVAAFILLLLTFGQTVFAFLSYLKPPRSSD